MSCEIHLTATLEGLNKILAEETSSQTSSNALLGYQIAISPTGEIIVFARKNFLVVCESKWDSTVVDGAKIKFTPMRHEHLICKEGEEITSILCLPFMSQKQSIQGCADWICIVVGFSSGCIRFYTEGLQELACSILHEEPILEMKHYCLTTGQQGKTQNQENNDFYVLYKTVICILNGATLSVTLQSRRNQLAKGISLKNDECYTPVDFKKYSFNGQDLVTDACFLGQSLVSSFNTFDHLVTASLVGGFSCNYRPSPPQTSLILTTGKRPFLGFHYTLESGTSPVLADVALEFANKLKNKVTTTLPDWFNFRGKKSEPSDKPKEVSQDYAEKLNFRFGLFDFLRQGQSIVVSPDGAFSAVSDSLGRVILIDNISGIAQQMWKGYRDAQCGFMQVQEDIRKVKRSRDTNRKPQPRQGLFVIIYTPKKGLIEIFTTQHGRRVASFKVTKNGRLLNTPRGHLGSNSSGGGINFIQNQVIFLSEEGLKEFSIPFHCALAEDNSKLSRDLHVLKKIKLLLKTEHHFTNSKFVEEIEKYAKELKTDEVRFQTIETMVNNKNTTLEAFNAVLNIFLENLRSSDRGDSTSREIVAFAETVHSLLSFYEFLAGVNDLPPNYDSVMESSDYIDSLSEELRLPQTELNILLKFIKQIKEIEGAEIKTTKVAFEDKKSMNLGKYLSSFDFEVFLSCMEKKKKMEDSRPCHLNLKSNSKEDKYRSLGEVLFKGVFNSITSLREWKTHVENCYLNPTDLAFSLLAYWCNSNAPSDWSSEICCLVQILIAICSLNDPDVVSVEYNTESPWWLQLRTFISAIPYTIRGLFAALSCRSVTIFIEQERELANKSIDKKQISKSNDDVSSGTSGLGNEWETMSKDTCQWDILITQLQDVALLNAVLTLTFKNENKPKVLPEIPFDYECQCLTSIQLNGTGRVSELVGKWLAQFGFDPSVFVDKNDLEFQRVQTPDGGKEEGKGKRDIVMELDKANEAKEKDENVSLALDYLSLLKSRFPYSLTASALLSNMCWEYIAHWYKNETELAYLQSAATCLEIIPSNRIKYGISYMSWNAYLQQKFESLAKMIDMIGKVPREKLCLREIGLRSDQVPEFLKLVGDYFKVMLHTEVDDVQDFDTGREAIWQNSSVSTAKSLVSVALSQPMADSDLLTLLLQLSSSLYIISGLNIKFAKVFSSLFDNLDKSHLSLTKNVHVASHHHNVTLIDSRKQFLQKAITAAVQTIEVVENIPPASLSDGTNVVPLTRLKADEYKKWLHLCFDLARVWAVSLDDLRRHQICELYSSGFDRLAEEVIPSVNENGELALQLLVLAGQRLNYIIRDSSDLHKKMTLLSPNLSDWLQSLDLDSRSQCGTIDDIDVLMRYILQWLPEGHSDQKLATAIIDSVGFLKNKNS